MSEIDVRIRPRPADWAMLPPPDAAQATIIRAAAQGSLVVRGAPSSGRTTTALAVLADAASRGESAILLVPDRARVDRLAAKVQTLLPTTVRPVRTPASFAYAVLSKWRTQRTRPLDGVELITGSSQDRMLADLLERVDAPWPESLNEQMRAVPGFRAELRALFARAGEAGLTGADLAAAGQEFGQEQWIACGRLLEEHLGSDAVRIEHPQVLAVDLSRIQALAAETIDHWEERAGDVGVVVEAPVPRVIVVDDLQDCTPSTIDLLDAAARQGARIVAFADSDVAIAGYRGGEPHLDLRLARVLGVDPLPLGGVHHQPQVVRRVIREVTGRITQSGPAERRRAEVISEETPAGGVLKAHLAASNAQLGALMARALRAHHLHEGLPWSDQAVIVRSSSMVEETTRYLRRGGVPVAGGSRAFDFAALPVTRMLLDLIRVRDEDASRPILDEQARAILTSSFIGMDPMELARILRRASAVRERATRGRDDPERAVEPDGPVGLSDLLEDSSIWRPFTGGRQVDALVRASAMWGVRSRAWNLRPRRALWEAWAATGVADDWRERAIRSDADSAWYDDQLDAVVALMRVADVWEQRNQGGRGEDFAEQMLSGTVPVDTISRAGIRPEGVQVLTPAQAVGGHWPVVAIIGLQDGIWPNTRLRDRLLRADLLADLGAGRFTEDAAGRRQLVDDPRSARRAVLDDELRLLAAALSRATGTIHIGAVRAQEAAPSAFFDILARYADVPRDQDDAILLEEVPAPLDLPGQIAELRREAANPNPSGARESATRLLALLAREGIRRAEPQRWLGAGGALSTSDPVAGPVVLSPSAFEAALDCPLNWFLARKVGATPASGDAQQLGTLIHSLAERNPHASEEEVLAALEERIDELQLDEQTWVGSRERERVDDIARATAQYLSKVPGRVDVEVDIRAEVEGVTIRGRLDRIEHVDDGVRIADLKTGKTKPRKADVEANAQLAAYQLALTAQGYDVAGARIAHVGTGACVIFTQPRLEGDALEEWLTKVRRIRDFAAGPQYTATPSQKVCKFCSFTKLCPAKDVGTRAVE